MKHNDTVINSKPDICLEMDKRIAYHQAGRAAAICLGNKQKQLPEVYFRIIIKQQERGGQPSGRLAHMYGKYTVKVEGGLLIQNLPFSFEEVRRYFSWPQQEEYRCAFEADVINLLAGSLAEAKYVALCDDEVFNDNLVNLGALHFYGGGSNMEVITEHMKCFIPDKAERDKKLAELFLAAYSFVNNRTNWDAISVLAKFIMAESHSVINCEKVVSLLESRLVA